MNGTSPILFPCRGVGSSGDHKLDEYNMPFIKAKDPDQQAGLL